VISKEKTVLIKENNSKKRSNQKNALSRAAMYIEADAKTRYDADGKNRITQQSCYKWGINRGLLR